MTKSLSRQHSLHHWTITKHIFSNLSINHVKNEWVKAVMIIDSWWLNWFDPIFWCRWWPVLCQQLLWMLIMEMGTSSRYLIWINEDIKHCSTLGSALHYEVESVGVYWSWVILPWQQHLHLHHRQQGAAEEDVRGEPGAGPASGHHSQAQAHPGQVLRSHQLRGSASPQDWTVC